MWARSASAAAGRTRLPGDAFGARRRVAGVKRTAHVGERRLDAGHPTETVLDVEGVHRKRQREGCRARNHPIRRRRGAHQPPGRSLGRRRGRAFELGPAHPDKVQQERVVRIALPVRQIDRLEFAEPERQGSTLSSRTGTSTRLARARARLIADREPQSGPTDPSDQTTITHPACSSAFSMLLRQSSAPGKP